MALNRYGLKLITVADGYALMPMIDAMRQLFAEVFSTHYTRLIETAWQHRGEQHADNVLAGFEDTIAKRFPLGVDQYTTQQKREILKTFYQGPGFDDEAAFLSVFHDWVGGDANTHYQQHSARLNAADNAEIMEYLAILQQANRELKKVNFVALVDSQNNVHGFMLCHLLKDLATGVTIVHIRQAAMREQHRGYAMTMARYFVDVYPKAYVEANQRHANFQAITRQLIDTGVVTLYAPVLGYSSKYFSIRSQQNLLSSLTTFFPKAGRVVQWGKRTLEAEDVSPRFFSPMQLARESLADDTQQTIGRAYLKLPRLK